MNKASTELVTAANEAVMKHHLKVNRPLTINEVGAVTTVAILRQLRIMMNVAEVTEIATVGVDGDVDWPSADDLLLIANDVEESL